ncbi:MAG: hypothetical protein Q9169_002532 [Polycauliona sp. 2 TL-2023]
MDCPSSLLDDQHGRKPARTRRAAQAEQYATYLNAIALLIAFKIGHCQNVATTFVRSPKHIRILWTVGGGTANISEDPQAVRAVTRYLEGVRRRTFECNNLRDLLGYIILECRPRVLHYFKRLRGCMARGSPHPIQSRVFSSTRFRGWNEELRILVSATHHTTIHGEWPKSMRNECATNCDLCFRKVSEVDRDTSPTELVELVVYCFFLTTDFGKGAPLWKELRGILAEVGDLWDLCGGLRQYITSARKRCPDFGLSIEFEHLPTNPPQTITHNVWPMPALTLAARGGDTSFGGEILMANLATYNYTPVFQPGCPFTTVTTTSTPHPELRIVNYLFNDYKSKVRSGFHSERHFPIGLSSALCHWCALYFESIRLQLEEDYCDAIERRQEYIKVHGHRGPVAPFKEFRPDKQVVVNTANKSSRSSQWILPADSPPEVKHHMEILVAKEFDKLLRHVKALGLMTFEQRERLEAVVKRKAVRIQEMEVERERRRIEVRKTLEARFITEAERSRRKKRKRKKRRRASS